jgi:hypothetical protein
MTMKKNSLMLTLAIGLIAGASMFASCSRKGAEGSENTPNADTAKMEKPMEQPTDTGMKMQDTTMKPQDTMGTTTGH